MNVLTGFLTSPWFAVAGLVLGSVPIIIHLLNRTFYNRMEWAAMEFLIRAEEKTRSRVQLENFLLLLLRFLLIALLGLALAQPFISHQGLAGMLGGERTHYILVIDSSYSMQKQTGEGTTSFTRARNRAESLIDTHFQEARRDSISIISANRNPQILIEEPSRNRSRALEVINQMEPSAYSSELSSTLESLQRVLDLSPDEAEQEVFWLTDMQRRAWVPEGEDPSQSTAGEALRGISDDVDVFLMDTGDDRRGNMGVIDLTIDQDFVTTGRPVTVQATVENYGTEPRTAEIVLHKDESPVESTEVHLEPGSTTEVRFQDLAFDSIGPSTLSVSLSSDLLPVDDQRYRALNVREQIQILMVDGHPNNEDPTEQETYFLEQALNPGNEQTPYQTEVSSYFEFQERSLSPYDLILFADVPSIQSDQFPRLHNFLNQGGGLLMFMGDQVTLEAYNENLYPDEDPILPGRLIEQTGTRYEDGEIANLTDLQMDHPALRFFRDHQSLVQGLITHTWIDMELDEEDPGVSVLARYDREPGSPAILERRFERGRLLFFTTSASMDWNLWGGVQGEAFLPLVDQTVQYVLRSRMELRNLSVGETLQLPLAGTDLERSFRIRDPLDRTTTQSPVPGERGSSILLLEQLDTPGFYRVAREEENQTGTYRPFDVLSVNVNPEEGNIRRIEQNQLEELYPGFSFEWLSETDITGEEETTEPDRSHLWFYFAIVVLAFLLLESLFGLRIDRKRQV